MNGYDEMKHKTFLISLELIKVYDGIASFRHHSYKLISVPRHTSIEQLVAAAMWAFHLTGDPGTFWPFHLIVESFNVIICSMGFNIFSRRFLFDGSVWQFRKRN